MPQQRRQVERAAAARGISVGEVIREAIDAHVGAAQHRDEAMERLFGLDAPVDDWAVMKHAAWVGGDVPVHHPAVLARLRPRTGPAQL